MHISEWMFKNDKNQADLARAIGRDRVRAHRIVKKGAKPNDEEMPIIHSWTGGAVTANDFYNLFPRRKKNGHKK